MNTKKSANNTIQWLESLGEFGEQCIKAIQEAGGLHEGPLMQWVYHADKDLSFKIKFSVSNSKIFTVPARINEKTLDRETPKGLGQFIVEWFLASDVGKTQKDLSHEMFNKVTNPIRQELFALRDLFGDKSFALSKFSIDDFKNLKSIQIKDWKSVECYDQKLFDRIKSVNTDEEPEAYKELLFSDEEIGKMEKVLNSKKFDESSKNLVKKTKQEKIKEYKEYKKDVERKVTWLTSAGKNFKKREKTEHEHSFENDSTEGSQKEIYSSSIGNKMLEWSDNYPYEKRIRSYLKILLEAFFPESEESWQQKRKDAKKELIGDIKDAKLAPLSTQEIKDLANQVKEMRHNMLEKEEKGEFKTPKQKPKLKQEYKGKFLEFSKKFRELTKTKEQRLEEDNKKKDQIIEEQREENQKMKRQLEEIKNNSNKKIKFTNDNEDNKDKIIGQQNEEIQKLKKELEESRKRERELLNSKENEQNDKKTRTVNENNEEKAETKDSFVNIMSNKKEKLLVLKLGNFSELENFLKQNEVEDFAETINELKNATNNNQLDNALQHLWTLVHTQFQGEGDIMNPLKSHIEKIIRGVDNYAFEPNLIVSKNNHN